MSTTWERSILPADRDPGFWNPMLDGIAVLYRERKPGEQFAGMTVTLINGDLTSVLMLEKDGKVRRVTLPGEAGAELECEGEAC